MSGAREAGRADVPCQPFASTATSNTSTPPAQVLQFLHEAKMKGVPGAFRRPDLAYWQRWVLGECSMPKRSLWIAERASAWDRVRGYLVAGVRGRRRGGCSRCVVLCSVGR